MHNANTTLVASKLSELALSHAADELLTGRRGPFLYLEMSCPELTEASVQN